MLNQQTVLKRGSVFVLVTTLALMLLSTAALLYFFNQKTGLFAKASSEKFYVGLLKKASQKTCTQIKSECYRINDETDGNKLILVTTLDSDIRQNFEQLVNKNKKVKVRGLMKKAQFSDKNTISYLLVDKITVLSEIGQSSFGENFFGLAGYSELNPQIRLGQLVIELGAINVNSGIRWQDFEPVKGNNTYPTPSGPPPIWGTPDNKLLRCQELNGHCTLQLYKYPAWAMEKATAFRAQYKIDHPELNVAPGPCEADPIDDEDVEAMAQFAKKVAERYDGDGIDDAPGSPIVYSFIFHNEPDHSSLHPDVCGFPVYGSDKDLNQNGNPDYVDYAKALKRFYEAVKEAYLNNNGSGKEINVSFGGIIGEGDPDPERKFVSKVLEYTNSSLGGRQYFDFMNFHYYGDWSDTPLNTPGDANKKLWAKYDPYSKGGIRGKTAWFRERLSKYGLESTPIILSETGYCLTEEQVQRQAGEEFKLLTQAASSGLDSIHKYTMVQPSYSCTLIYANPAHPETLNTPKPAYVAYQTLIRHLRDYRFVSTDKANEKYIEGYIFIKNDKSTTKEILWYRRMFDTLPDKPGKTVYKSFPYKIITTISITGEEKTIEDGGGDDFDRRKNGIISLKITEEPVIVSWQ